jgi:lipoprotein-anchoring transpeptidase ErfK/SrfK
MRVSACVPFVAALLVTGPAAAQYGRAVQPAAAPPGSLGGGFIELLLTGRDPSPVYRPAPVAVPGGPPVMPWAYGRPTHAPRVAALPVAPGADFRPARTIDPVFRRQTVEYDGPHRPGTIIIDTPSKHLYLVQPGGKAIRYGIGVGRPGFEWAGVKSVTRKAEWPDWTPPPQMLKRRPDLPRHMKGGPDNPMGARALYLGSSLYRIHGTNEPHTIGQAVSSGCIRMMNEDVIDLYNRVGVGARVIVI